MLKIQCTQSMQPNSVSRALLMFAQVLSTRARKDVAVGDIKVHACVFAFDCLYLNGEVMLRKPMTERREALMSAMVEVPGELQFAVAKTSNDVEELQVWGHARSVCTCWGHSVCITWAASICMSWDDACHMAR